MKFKVREVKTGEQKSVQEVEAELLKKHDDLYEKEKADEVTTIPPTTEEVVTAELKDEDVLSFIEKKYNKKLSSVDELFAAREPEELPEDVATFLKYKKETGRGINDFTKLQRDIDSIDPDTLLMDYYMAIEDGVDKEDAQAMLDELNFDEDEDEADIKRAKLAKKRAVNKAKKYFNEAKEKYKQPLESSSAVLSEDAKKEMEAYKQYIQQAKTQEEEGERKRNWFLNKTEEVFNNEFKGFEFDVNGKKLTINLGDPAEIKKSQLSPMNFINKYLDEGGLMKDAAGYHRALAVAMNPEKFAKFFYEQGVSEATEDIMRKTKNINMSERKTPEAVSKGGFQVKSLNNDSGNGLRIRSIKKS